MKKADPTSYGIVLSGGGTRSAYAVGALKRLHERGIRKPKVLVAISGGAAPGEFYLAGRFDDMYAWAKKFDDPRFISWKRLWHGPVMDTDDLVDRILRGQAPKLELELSFVDTKRFTAVTKLPKGEQCWLSEEPVIDKAIDMLLYGFLQEPKR